MTTIGCPMIQLRVGHSAHLVLHFYEGKKLQTTRKQGRLHRTRPIFSTERLLALDARTKGPRVSTSPRHPAYPPEPPRHPRCPPHFFRLSPPIGRKVRGHDHNSKEEESAVISKEGLIVTLEAFNAASFACWISWSCAFFPSLLTGITLGDEDESARHGGYSKATRQISLGFGIHETGDRTKQERSPASLSTILSTSPLCFRCWPEAPSTAKQIKTSKNTHAELLH